MASSNLLYVHGINVPCDATEQLGYFREHSFDELPQRFTLLTPRMEEDVFRRVPLEDVRRHIFTMHALVGAQVRHPRRDEYEPYQCRALIAAVQFYDGLCKLLGDSK
jgi:hypothetical protein